MKQENIFAITTSIVNGKGDNRTYTEISTVRVSTLKQALTELNVPVPKGQSKTCFVSLTGEQATMLQPIVDKLDKSLYATTGSSYILGNKKRELPTDEEVLVAFSME